MVNESNLDRARRLLEQADQAGITDGTENMGLHEFVVNTIKTNVCSTIGIQYKDGQVQVACVYSNETKISNFDGYGVDGYEDFCKDILKIDMNEQENCSRSLFIEGVRTRVFASMPPYAQEPVVTISTTKQPPDRLNNQIVSDDLLDQILHSNFMIVGGSGSGKTYLMNYMLSKFTGRFERLGLIEEFSELIPPNDVTIQLTVPPPKSHEKSKLRHITEQSNLMRLDGIFVGEIKGAEAWPFVTNMSSGTRSACTMHGDTAEHALARLSSLCQIEMPHVEVVNELISKSIKYVIVQRNHKIYDIKELTGTHHAGNFSMKSILGETKEEETIAKIRLGQQSRQTFMPRG